MYRHILVPIAFDEDHPPDRAIALARLLAAADGRVSLLHVMPEVPTFAISYMPEGYGDNLRRAVMAELETLAAPLPGGRAHVEHGDPGRAILSWAEDNEADCIVIASHRPGLGDYLLGSTTARVVRHATCSVHVLR
jgi:nucleotide-binding universal stress UspA family protein